jgi:hypothetical protein
MLGSLSHSHRHSSSRTRSGANGPHPLDGGAFASRESLAADPQRGKIGATIGVLVRRDQGRGCSVPLLRVLWSRSLSRQLPRSTAKRLSKQLHRSKAWEPSRRHDDQALTRHPGVCPLLGVIQSEAWESPREAQPTVSDQDAPERCPLRGPASPGDPSLRLRMTEEGVGTHAEQDIHGWTDHSMVRHTMLVIPQRSGGISRSCSAEQRDVRWQRVSCRSAMPLLGAAARTDFTGNPKGIDGPHDGDGGIEEA